MKTFLFFLFLLASMGAGGYYWFVANRPAVPSDEGFATVKVEYDSLSDVISATGILQPESVTPIGSELPGKVVEVGAELNQDVVKEQVLLKLDDRQARQKLGEAQIAVRKAQQGLDAAKILREKAQYAVDKYKTTINKVGEKAPDFAKTDSELAEFDLKAAEANVRVAETTVKQAENARDQAQLGVDLTVVHAPSDGTIIEKSVFVNQLIGPPISGKLFLLAKDLKRMQFLAQVLENDIGKVVVGQKATFQINAYSDENKRFKGKVKKIYPMPTTIPGLTQQGPVYYTAVVDVENERDPVSKAWRLKAGMTATVDIVRREHASVWKMPVAALNPEMDPSYQSEAAKWKLKQFHGRKDADDWKPVWVFNKQKERMPIFVRIGGLGADKQPGIQDSQYVEVLEWDPDLSPNPDHENKGTYPQVIIAAPPVSKTTGFFSMPKVKI